MNKVLLSVLFLMAALNLASAQMEAPKTPAMNSAMAAIKGLSGTVKTVSLADAAKGTVSEVVVVDASAKSTTVLVKATTTLYDVDAKAITLDKILANSKVTVVYTTSAEGVNEAKSVKVIK